MALTQVQASMLAAGAARANFGAGAVLQVVNGTLGGAGISTTSMSNVTFGATASITPTSSTSKILIIATGPWSWYSGTDTEFCIGLTRGGVTIPTAGNDGLHPIYGKTPNGNAYSMTLLDSPSTTSSTTYSVVVHRIDAGTAALANGIRASQQHQITLLEIAA